MRAPRADRGRPPRVADLAERLREAEEALAAISEGAVDAIVVSGKDGSKVYSLTGADTVYRLIVESMQEAALTATPGGRILFCNSQLGRMLHRQPRSLLGRMLTELVPDEDHPTLASILRTAPSRPVRGRIRLRGRTETIPTYVSASFLPQQEEPSICLVAADLSELMASNSDLRLSNEELHKKTAQLRRLAARLAQTEHRERTRLASVLHDGLQQLLVGAQMQMARVIADGRDGADPGSRRVAELIDQSIEMSRSLAVEISPPIRAGAGLVTALRWLARSMEKHSLKVRVTARGPVANGGEELTLSLFLAVQELLLNTVKHAGVEAAAIWLGEVEDRLEIRVSDKGRGFNAKGLEGISGAGGFGLFSIQERLSLVGGRLVIHSKPGAGTSVTIRVPLSSLRTGGERAEAPKRGPLPASRQAPTRSPRKRRGPVHTEPGTRRRVDSARIMIVEDEGLVALQIKEMLERLGYEVALVARSGEEAVSRLGSARPDLILMDIRLRGGISGIEAAERIAALSDVPVVYVTAFSDPETLERAQVTQPYGFLVKPFEERTLGATIQTSLFRYRKRRGTEEGRPS